MNCRWECKMVQLPWGEKVNQFIIKLNIHLLQNSAILSLGIYLKETKADVQKTPV